MNAQRYRLVIGDKNLSSWSLRPWLAMTRAGLPFDEVNIDLRAPDKLEKISAMSPSGKVPALISNGETVWDSLAILEYLAERHAEAGLWPANPAARAFARSASAEMHSGFQALREHCPMNLLARTPLTGLPDAVAKDVRRIAALWRDCRERFGRDGPFLFSKFSAADAMFAPVASRFRTYLADLSPFGDGGEARAYVATIFAMPEMAAWEAGAREEVAAGAG